MSGKSYVGIAVLFAGVFAVAGSAADDVQLFTASGELRAALSDGTLLWRVGLAGQDGAEVVQWDGQTAVLSDGLMVDRSGLILGRATRFGERPAPFPGDGGGRAAQWDSLTEVTPPPVGADAHNPPFFDSAGNAWVIITHLLSGDYELRVRQSNGHDGTWGPLATISDTTNYVAGPEGTIDNEDNITIVFRDISGGYKLYALRYTPGDGWTSAQQMYSTSSFFQAIEIGADSAGNVAAVFDVNISWSPSAWTIVYDATTGTWGSAEQVSPAGYHVMLPAIIRNATGDAMYLVYLVTTAGVEGLYAHEWDSTTLSWGPAVHLPGSEVASFSGAGPVSRLPGVVDALGDATVFWSDTNVYPHASRCEGGMWQPAVMLLTADIVDVENFAGTAVSSMNDVFGIMSQFDSGKTRFFAFLYKAGDGWQPPENPYSPVLSIATRVRAAFYQGRRAVGTVLGMQGGTRQLVSLLFDGESWSPDLLDIPEEEDAFYSDLVSDRGEVLLVYEGEASGANQGIKSTFLRDPHVGDMNCDGSINFFDIEAFVLALTGGEAAFHDMYPDCYWLNADCNEDGEVNFFDIDAFVELIIS